MFNFTLSRKNDIYCISLKYINKENIQNRECVAYSLAIKAPMWFHLDISRLAYLHRMVKDLRYILSPTKFLTFYILWKAKHSMTAMRIHRKGNLLWRCSKKNSINNERIPSLQTDSLKCNEVLIKWLQPLDDKYIFFSRRCLVLNWLCSFKSFFCFIFYE